MGVKKERSKETRRIIGDMDPTQSQSGDSACLAEFPPKAQHALPAGTTLQVVAVRPPGSV